REEGSSRLMVSNSTFDVGESFNSGVAVVLFGPPNLPSQDLLIVDSTIRAGLDGINTQNVSRLTIERCAFFVPYVDAINLWTDEDVTLRANHSSSKLPASRWSIQRGSAWKTTESVEAITQHRLESTSRPR